MTETNNFRMPPEPPIRNPKNLIYNGKKYLVNFDMLKIYSNYFYNERKNYKDIRDIQLHDELIEIDDGTFQNFVNFCNGHKYELNDSNVFELRQLSIHYEVTELKKITQNHISNNPELILRSSFFKLIQHQSLSGKMVEESLKEDEEIISANLLKFIDDERLLSLPIPVLYRILNGRQFNINEMNETNQTKVIGFIFKCLDKKGRKASVLFTGIDFERSPIDIMQRLLYEYSDIFDFNLTSKPLFKTALNLLSEVNKMTIEIDKLSKNQNNETHDLKLQISELSNIIKSQRNENENLITEISSLKTSIENQKKEYDNKILELEKKINQITNQDFGTKINTLNSRIESLNSSNESFHRKSEQTTTELSSKINNLETRLTSQINNKFDELKRNSQSLVTKDILNCYFISNFF